jgi:histidinol-phosphate aminotransferase
MPHAPCPMFNFIRSDLNQLSAYSSHLANDDSVDLDKIDNNESPLDLPVELKEKLAWTYQHQLATNRYPDGSHLELRAAIAVYVNEFVKENTFKTENISVGNGSDELIRSLLIATCLGGEGSILVAAPTFSMYAILAKTLAIPVVTVARREKDFAIDLVQAQAAIESTHNPPIRVVFVVNPNSPTGNALTVDELNWLRAIPENILVVIDEAYFEFSRKSQVEELQQQSNWIVLRTFSKAFRLATHRVGYAIAHSEIIEALEKVRLPYNLPGFSQAAAAIALQNRHLILPYIDRTLEERSKMYNVLSEIKAIRVWQSDANFFYIRPQNLSQDAVESDRQLSNLMNQLKEKGTLIRHTGGGLRITVGTPEENARTLARLKHLKLEC